MVLVAAAIGVWVAVDRRTTAERPKPPAPTVQRFVSRPDLVPASLRVTVPARGTAPGYVFLAPKGGKLRQQGPMIVDDENRLVWFHPMPEGRVANDFRVQRYRGEPVLTWWEGRTNARGSFGQGSFVIADRSYREIARVRAGRGQHGDLHEFLITGRGTALMTIYDRVPADLSSVDGPRRGEVIDSIVQEVDLATGRVLFEWRSRDHVALSESYAHVSRRQRVAYDYFHINSIDVDRDGNLLVSARNTWAVYKIDRKTGEVIWRLAGKKSDFRLGPGVPFAWQHDAQRQPDGTITVFDNSATPKVADHSRAIRLRVDERRRTANVARAYAHPGRLLSWAEGNYQALSDGGALVNWGYAAPHVSEFSRDGRLRFDLRLPTDADSYRAYRFRWDGQPASRPAAAVRGGADGRLTVYASWNGATAVTGWQVLAGPRPDALAPIGSAARTGFETPIEVTADEPYIAVQAMAGERALETSSPIWRR
jgi:hypothetical protein